MADFGLACLYDKQPPAPTAAPMLDQLPTGALNTPLTAAGTITGTPGYMSPEQYRGDPVDSRSDQFSFCVALYEALYQQLPFSGSTVSELAANTIAGRLRAPPTGSLVPAEIRNALRRGLAVEPEARFANMAELLAALELNEHDPARGRVTRWRISVALLIGCALLAVVSHSAKSALVPRDLVLLSSATLAMLGVVFVAFRRVLERNTLTRELIVMALISVFTTLLLRAAGWKLGLPTTQIFPLDLFVMSGLLAMMAHRNLHGLWWAALGVGIAAAVELQRPQYAEQITKSVYTTLPAVLIFVWLRAARSGPARAAVAPAARKSG